MTDHDRKLLWTKAGNRCSYRFNGVICDEELIKNDNCNNVIIGDECHIVAKHKSTSRWMEEFQDRDGYENIILMCKIHHKMIDSLSETFTVDILKHMKNEHESNISERLKNKEIEPLIIKDSFFNTEVKNADKAVGMEVNRPAQLSNVKSNLKVENVKEAIGFSTNQGMHSILAFCKNCNKPFSYACVGNLPSILICPHCNYSITRQ